MRFSLAFSFNLAFVFLVCGFLRGEIWHTIDGVVYDTYTFPLGGRSCVEDANEYKQNTASRKDYAWHKNKLMAVVCVIGVCVGDCVDGKDKISALGLW